MIDDQEHPLMARRRLFSGLTTTAAGGLIAGTGIAPAQATPRSDFCQRLADRRRITDWRAWSTVSTGLRACGASGRWWRCPSPRPLRWAG
jgi:hypothetical protein